MFGAHGLPMSLYTDRGAHYFHAAETGGKIDRSHLTQVGRALEQLGVEPIGAYSPQARGRSERAFQTLQDRLVKELRLAGITSIEAANAFICEVYLPAYNERFAAPAAEPGSAFTSIPGVDLSEILCVQEERQVGNDNCVSYRTLKLQIPESPRRPHFVKARVKVHLYPDGSHALFHGRAASAGTTGRERSGMRKTPLKSARRRARGNGDNAKALVSRPAELHRQPLAEPSVNSRLTGLPSGQRAGHAETPVHEEVRACSCQLFNKAGGANFVPLVALELPSHPGQ